MVYQDPEVLASTASNTLGVPSDQIKAGMGQFHHDDRKKRFVHELLESRENRYQAYFGQKPPNDVEGIYNSSCDRCVLHEDVYSVCVGADVIPDDPKDVKYLWVGEAPGKNEDERNTPFVGKAGQKLRHVMRQTWSYDWTDEMVDGEAEVYAKSAITNAVKCRPSGNRDPKTAEKNACDPYLQREIEYFDPDLVICLGSEAISQVFGKKEGGVTSRRGEFYVEPRTGRKFYATCHPQATNYDHWWRPFFVQDMKNIASHELEGRDRPDVELVETPEDVDKMIDELIHSPRHGFDLETIGQSPYREDEYSGLDPDIICLSIAPSISMTGYVVPKYRMDKDRELRLNQGENIWDDYTINERHEFKHPVWDEAIEQTRTVLEDENVESLAHNAKFDMNFLHAFEDIYVENAVDTMGLSALHDERPGTGSLGASLQRMLGWSHKGEVELLFERIKKSRRHFGNIPWDRLWPYAGLDSVGLLPLREKYEQVLRDRERGMPWEDYPQWSDEGSMGVFENVLTPALYSLFECETHGALIHKDRILKYRDKVQSMIEDRMSKLRSINRVSEFEIFRGEERGHDPEPYNPDSPKQTRRLIFKERYLDEDEQGYHDNFGCPVLSQTKTGNPSTNSDDMEKLLAYAKNRSGRIEHPEEFEQFCDLYLEISAYNKMNSGFLTPIPELMDPMNRLHTEFNLMAGTRTGRTSSSNPNLQNIPKKADSVKLRKAFIPPEDHIWLSMDFSQMELRVIASLSGDKKMHEIYHSEDGDLHNETLDEMKTMPEVPERIQKDLERRDAKDVNFGMVYGIGAEALSEDMGVPEDVGQAFLDAFYHRYPGVGDFEEEVAKFVQEHGYVDTPFGRRRHLPRAHSEDDYWNAKAIRRAVNFPVQSSASDITLLSMIRLKQAIEERDLRSNLILNVHDEINFECHKDEVETVYNLCKDLCEDWEDLDWLTVPVEVDVEIGKNWGDLVEI